MKNCIYFAENYSFFPCAADLALGFGFTDAGLWRSLPVPDGAAGLVIDDRFLPDRQGLAKALQALTRWEGLILFDFERPRFSLLAELIRALPQKRIVLPPAYAELPYEAVLVGPWQGSCPLRRWLSAQQSRYGSVVLDGAPLRVRAVPGGLRSAWRGPLPDTGFSCDALGCLHRRLPDGTLLFWDTRNTLTARLESAQTPAILLGDEFRALPGRALLPESSFSLDRTENRIVLPRGVENA